MRKLRDILFQIAIATLLIVLAACQAVPAVVTERPALTQAIEEPLSAQRTSDAIAVPLPSQTPEIFLDTTSLKDVEISILYPWIDEGEQKFQSLISDFNATNTWGIKVSGSSSLGYEALADRLANQSVEEDLIIAHGYDLDSFAISGGLSDMQSLLSDPDLGLGELFRENSPYSTLAPNSSAVIACYDIPLLYQPGLIYYNQTWAEKLGFSYAPKTFTELETQLLAGMKSLLQDINIDNNGAGGLWLSKTPISALSWYEAFGGGEPINGTVLNRDHLLQDFIYLKKLFMEDASWTGAEPVPHDYFVNRLALAYEGSLEDLPIQEGSFSQSSSSDEWVSLPYPTENGSGSISMETTSAAIPKGNSEKQLAAWIFLRWLLSPEAQAKLVEVEGLWPATGSPAEVAPSYASAHPAWASAALPGVRYNLAPKGIKWAFSRLILQDAAMRLYALDEEYFPAILDMLETTLQEFGGTTND